MNYLYVCLSTLLLFVNVANAQDPVLPPNEVPGLKLPAAQVVNFDEGFITLNAECIGQVEWLVLSTSVKIKFKVNPATPNEIDVAIPPYEASIAVFCNGVVDGKLTKHARTDITVKGPTKPIDGPDTPPDPKPDPKPNPPKPDPPDFGTDPAARPPFHLSIVEDVAKLGQINSVTVNNQPLLQFLRNKQVIFRTIKSNDRFVADANFDVMITRYGLPLLVFQDTQGRALVIGRAPATEAEVRKMIKPYIGQ